MKLPLTQVLTQAHAREATTQELRRKLQRVLADLHPRIYLPEAERLASLQGFVEQYLAHIPRLVAALEAAGREAQQERLIAPLLEQIQQRFQLQPGEGLVQLLEQAYFVQRLVEELNDRFMLLAGAPLLTLDMTTANLIIHSLIGEPYANQLDEEALSVARDLVDNHVGAHAERFYATQSDQRLRMWARAWQHWSDELGVNDIELRLPG